jgi:pilus assembly protein CpaB
VNDVSGVAGFIQPSDSVDVLVTRTLPGGDGRQVTDVLIQNVKVIAIDQNAQTADGKPVVARTATLEVVPTDAQKLALGQQVGQLSLVLRKPGQEQDSTARTVSLNDLRYSYYGTATATPASLSTGQPARRVTAVQRRPARPARVAVVPRPTTKSVEVVRGTQGSNYEVGGYGS